MPGLSLPALGFGTGRLRDRTPCVDAVTTALNVGYRFVDTAQLYGNEACVGEAIRRADIDRGDVVVASKVRAENLAPEDVLTSTAESLNRLGLDALDLLYVHWPASAYDPEGTLAAFARLVAEGTVDHVGVSNFTSALLEEAVATSAVPIVANQVEMHPLLQQDDLLAHVRDHDMYLVAYAPVARGEVFEVPTLTDIASKHGATAAQVSLAWLVQRDGVVPIPNATGDHIGENFGARSLQLDREDVSRIAAIDRELRLVDPDLAPWNR